jgi:hypothetical protein
MSSRIGRCPECQRVGQHMDLPDEARVGLLETAGLGSAVPTAWTARAAWCPDCAMPYVVLWPTHEDVDTRYRLAGFPDELIRIVKEGET